MANCCYSLMDRNEPGTLFMPRQGAKVLEEFMVVIEIPNAAQLPRVTLACRRSSRAPTGRGSAHRQETGQTCCDNRSALSHRPPKGQCPGQLTFATAAYRSISWSAITSRSFPM